MRRFTLRIDTPLPASEAWQRVLDLDSHTRLIPFTTLYGATPPASAPSPAELGHGSRFVARTGPALPWGPGWLRGRRLGLVDDSMEIESWDPPAGAGPDGTGEAPGQDRPGRCRIHKRGRVIHGDIDLTVTPTRSGSTVEWTQRIAVPAVLDVVTVFVARIAYGTVLRRLLSAPDPRQA